LAHFYQAKAANFCVAPKYDLLDAYIKVHDEIRQKSAKLRSLFTHVSFEKLLVDAQSLLPSFCAFLVEIEKFKAGNYDFLSQSQKDFFDCLSEYSHALAETVQRLIDGQSLLLKGSRRRGSVSWSEHKRYEAAYRSSVDNYVKLGYRLATLYERTF
jgi:hypothetical protein